MSRNGLAWLAFMVIGVSLAAGAWAQSRGTSPDSLRAVLGVTLADKGLVELRGETVNDFRLYLAAEQSRVGWWLEDTLYLYTLRGEEHDRRAMDLFALLRQGGLASFVTERHGKRPPGMNPHVEVRALHLAAMGVVGDETPRGRN